MIWLYIFGRQIIIFALSICIYHVPLDILLSYINTVCLYSNKYKFKFQIRTDNNWTE